MMMVLCQKTTPYIQGYITCVPNWHSSGEVDLLRKMSSGNKTGCSIIIDPSGSTREDSDSNSDRSEIGFVGDFMPEIM